MKQFLAGCLASLILIASLQYSMANPRPARVRIVDENDQPVSFAHVQILQADGTTRNLRANDVGEFSLDGDWRATLPAEIRIFAAGYTIGSVRLSEESGLSSPIVLRTARVGDSVTVTAARAELPLTRSTNSVILLSSQEQRVSPAQTLDDLLRKIPGFTLFRRSSSLVAHPTSQGVSLRGVGPSGVSRSLVLADGIPLSDPFGGWVHWARVPRISLERIEVLRGGASELYGTGALGGVVQLLRRKPAPKTLRASASWGSFRDSEYALYASHQTGHHSMALSGQFFRTEGFVQVPESQRGAVDIAARSKSLSMEAEWRYQWKEHRELFARVSMFSEKRGNGTPLQNNDTQIRSMVVGTRFLTGVSNEWSIQSFLQGETFDSTFSAIRGAREVEFLTRAQRVPSTSLGAQGLWKRRIGDSHLLLAGIDYQHIKGASDERSFFGERATGATRIDGRQDLSGYYIQDLFQPTRRLQLVFGARFDYWRNHDAFVFDRRFSTGNVTSQSLPPRNHFAASPKVGARIEWNPEFSLRSSVSWSFRAPTLNELYRPFRVGNVVTNANADLDPERAATAEFGIDYGLTRPLAFRGTFFWTEIANTIANVTTSIQSDLIIRQRQNLGATRSRGIELDVSYQLSPTWLLSAGYFLSDSRVLDAPQSPNLAGLRIPQVPRHQGVLQALYENQGRFYANVLLRITGEQFDDDLNQFPLNGYPLMDFGVGKSLNSRAEIFVAVENLFDREYPVGRTPVERIGTPRRIHGGIRIQVN